MKTHRGWLLEALFLPPTLSQHESLACQDVCTWVTVLIKSIITLPRTWTQEKASAECLIHQHTAELCHLPHSMPGLSVKRTWKLWHCPWCWTEGWLFCWRAEKLWWHMSTWYRCDTYMIQMCLQCGNIYTWMTHFKCLVWYIKLIPALEQPLPPSASRIFLC